MRRFLIGLFFLGSMSWGQTVSWSDVQNSREYKIAREHVADALPNLAIPVIQELLKNEALNSEAKAELLTFLGEAQLRAHKLEEALFTFADPALVEFSPAHELRGYTLSQLGHYQEAIESFRKIDRRSMIPRAKLQQGVLLTAIGDQKAALNMLKPLLKTEDVSIREEATLRYISILLAQGILDEAEENLKSFELVDRTYESHLQFLRGKLLLLNGSRLAAVGLFEALLKKTEEPDHGLSAPLVHELHLALADSRALDGNELDGAASILSTLEKYPESPRIREAFQRLNKWAKTADPKPILQKLNEWIAQSSYTKTEFPFLSPLESDSVSTSNELVTSTFLSPRSAYALLLIAKENLSNPETRSLGLAQLERLLIVAPSSHPDVRYEALTIYGLTVLSNREYEHSFNIFVRLLESSPSLSSQALASALIGKAAYALLDKRKASQAFLASQSLADSAMNAELSRLSALNAGISLLSIADPAELDQITKDLKTPESRADLLLERGLRLSDIDDPSARDLLDQFLTEFPEHPRHDEAALSLAECYLFSQPRRKILARKHLKLLSFDLENQPTLEARRVLAFLQINEGMELADEFLKKLPDHPFSPRIAFQQGRAYQRIVDKPRKAYLSFEGLIANYPEDPLVEVARLQSAISAIATGTKASEEGALKRFKELIEGKGVLATEAAILRVRFLIDQGKQQTADEEIEDILKKKDLPSSYRWRALVLRGEAQYQLNNDEKALEAYNDLLTIKKISIATRNRASFLKGRSLKNLERFDEALETFYSVVNRQIDPERMNDLEWKWFDECGKGALKLLEEKKQWTAAIKLAEKISRSGSPFASDAAERAKHLRLEHFIWN